MQTQLPDKAKAVSKATLFCVAFTGLFVLLSFLKPLLPIPERFAYGLIGTFAAFLVTFLFLKFDRKTFSDIEIRFERNTIAHFLVGVLCGIAIMGLLAASVLHFKHVSITLNEHSGISHFLLSCTPLIPLAFMEELGFRAYPLQILKDKAGVRASIIITSILFALYHIVNGWSITSSFLGPAAWGLIFGLAAVYSKGIAMPTGIHFAANLTTSAFGAKDNSHAIWTVVPTDTVSTSFYGMDLTVILPSIAVFLVGFVTIEIYLREKPADDIALAKKA